MTTHAPTAKERAAFVAPRPKRRWWQTRKGTAAGTAGGKVVYFARSATIIDPSTQAHYLDRSDLAFRADSTVAVSTPNLRAAIMLHALFLASAHLMKVRCGCPRAAGLP